MSNDDKQYLVYEYQDDGSARLLGRFGASETEGRIVLATRDDAEPADELSLEDRISDAAKFLGRDNATQNLDGNSLAAAKELEIQLYKLYHQSIGLALGNNERRSSPALVSIVGGFAEMRNYHR